MIYNFIKKMSIFFKNTYFEEHMRTAASVVG